MAFLIAFLILILCYIPLKFIHRTVSRSMFDLYYCRECGFQTRNEKRADKHRLKKRHTGEWLEYDWLADDEL